MNVFNKSPQRNFEWFEISFTQKLQEIINENQKDSYSWIRDSFISLFLAMLSLLCQILDNTKHHHILTVVFTIASIISAVGLLGWLLFCAVKYSKRVARMKERLVPHSIKDSISVVESVKLFDNDVCNNLVLSRNYIELAKCETEDPLIEFYLIESVHYYFTSIRLLNKIILANDFDKLFAKDSGVEKRINLLRLKNYLTLLGAITINKDQIKPGFNYDNINLICDSYLAIRESFGNTLRIIKEYSSRMGSPIDFDISNTIRINPLT